MSVRERQRGRFEDLRWLIEAGEGTASAARRMGLTPEGLYEWLRRHDKDIWRQLRANERRHTGGCVLATSRLESAS